MYLVCAQALFVVCAARVHCGRARLECASRKVDDGRLVGAGALRRGWLAARHLGPEGQGGIFTSLATTRLLRNLGQALTPVGWTCCGHGRCTRAAWCRPQLRCRPAWSWRPTSGVVSGRRLNESVEQRVTSVPLESLPGRNPGAGPWNTPRSRLSRIAGHSRAARSERRRTLKKASIAGGGQKSLPNGSIHRRVGRPRESRLGLCTTSVSACLAAAAVTPRQIRRFSVSWKPGKFAQLTASK